MFRGFWGSSIIKPPFRVTSADVVIICPAICAHLFDYIRWKNRWPSLDDELVDGFLGFCELDSMRMEKSDLKNLLADGFV